MNTPQYIPYMGPVPALTTAPIFPAEATQDLVVKSKTPYRRYAVQAQDNGLDTFGIRQGDFVLFREQRWPNDECQVCLITMGDEITMRVLEYVYNPTVTLRVSSYAIPAVEIDRMNLCVIGVLDGVISSAFATFSPVNLPIGDLESW